MISKICLTIFFILLNNLLFSQKRENIYLEFSKPTSVSKDKNLIIEMYKLTFENCSDKVTKISLLKDNVIASTINVKANTKPTLTFIYNSQNNPIKKITVSNDINFLSIEKLQNVEPTSFIETLKSFKNIFIVDKKKRARKVSFEVLGNL